MDDIVFIGDWIKDRVLGSGSFGTVVLWKNKRTDEKLAIKSCKWGNELTEKHKERWTKEVDMLKDCQNPNIVGTKELPPEFIQGLARANPSGLPILCMEYCSGGDLRQVLNRPESCAGLKERQVRQILTDIGNAMQFLHQKKITHRDLKPENIVMHNLNNVDQVNSVSQGHVKVIYKLIDLGYAKEIDFHSVCASFVGTLQYLAPELLYSKTYSNSVDFWSFGLLTFEIICGQRPFLPFMSTAQWMPYVEKKAHENISIYETFHGDIEYSNEIFPENHISKPFKKFIEKWLTIALEWDPKLRGRDTPSRVTFNIPTQEKEVASKIILFDLLTNLLSKKIIKIFSISTLSHMAYNIDDTVTVETLKLWIQKDINIPPSEQILICPNTHAILGNEATVSNYWNDHSDVMLYLFNKMYIVKDNIEPVVPKAVQRCLEHPKALYNFKNGYNLYRNGMYFVINQMEIYNSLINGLFIRAESLKSEGREILLKHNSVDKNLGNLLAQEEILKRMIGTGKEHIEKLRENGIATNLLGNFDKVFKEADELFERINKLQNAWNQLSVRLQSAKRRCNEVISDDVKQFVNKSNFQTIYTNAYKIYIMYLKSESLAQNKGKERQCHDITKVCYDCLKLRTKILLEINHQPFILKLIDLSTEFTKIVDILKNAADNIEKLTNDLKLKLDELNNCMWSTITVTTKNVENLSDIPYSVISFEKKGFKVGEPVSTHCINVANRVQDDDKLKYLIEESLKIRKINMHLTEKLNSQKEMLQRSTFDFSFLNDV